MRSYTFTISEEKLLVVKELLPDLEFIPGTQRLSGKQDEALLELIKDVKFLLQQGGLD